MDHISWCEINPNKFKRIEITQGVFSDHSGIKLEISATKDTWKSSKHSETRQHTSKQSMGQRESQWKSLNMFFKFKIFN